MVRLLRRYFLARIDYPVLLELALIKYPFSCFDPSNNESVEKVSLNLDNTEGFKAMRNILKSKSIFEACQKECVGKQPSLRNLLKSSPKEELETLLQVEDFDFFMTCNPMAIFEQLVGHGV